MKIVDVTEFYSERGGGVRSHLAARGHFLCQRGHDHVVIAPGPRDEDAGPDSAVAAAEGTSHSSASEAPDTRQATACPAGATARVIRIAGPPLPYDRTYHLLGRLDKIRSRVEAERPDVLEAHSPYLAAAAVIACGRRTWARTAFWHADHIGTYITPALSRRIGRGAANAISVPLWRGIRAMLAPFQATFVAGRAQADHLRAAGVRNVIHAPFGVDTTTFHPSAASEARRQELLGGANPGALLLLGVGRFAFEKRWDVALEAFGRVRALREAVFVLFGDGPERAKLERIAPAGVRFFGFERDRARLASALASADLLVHACPYETFGLGVAEAVACGLPVVVPDAGGAAETLDPRCGRTYRSLDPGACADAIHTLLACDRAALRARSLEAAARVPSRDQHFAKVLGTYEALRRQRIS